MIEVELKSVVEDLDASRARVERAGGRLVFAGALEDRRYDTVDRGLAGVDHVLRTRVYRDANGTRAELGWKGPTSYVDGFKQREEIGSGVLDPESVALILEKLGFHISMAIDREIWQYELGGATVRFERYPCMDDLVEVEGEPEAIERAIVALALPREGFTSDRLPAFVRRFQARTNIPAALSRASAAATSDFELDDA
jgi:predicted adenylyl cyclase CyaB